MRTTMRRVLAISVLLVPMAIGGCALQSEVDQLRSDVSKAQAAAEAAQAEARAANARADAATKSAADVSRKADRMYNRSLRK